MKYSFFKEVNSFKKQLLETSEIDPTRMQSQTDNINITSILERLIVQLQDQISTLKNQLVRKDKVTNTLLEKLEKKHHEKFPLPKLQQMVHLLFRLQPLFKVPHSMM